MRFRSPWTLVWCGGIMFVVWTYSSSEPSGLALLLASAVLLALGAWRGIRERRAGRDDTDERGDSSG